MQRSLRTNSNISFVFPSNQRCLHSLITVSRLRSRWREWKSFREKKAAGKFKMHGDGAGKEVDAR